jgi:hypothetical protein
MVFYASNNADFIPNHLLRKLRQDRSASGTPWEAVKTWQCIIHYCGQISLRHELIADIQPHLRLECCAGVMDVYRTCVRPQSVASVVDAHISLINGYSEHDGESAR